MEPGHPPAVLPAGFRLSAQRREYSDEYSAAQGGHLAAAVVRDVLAGRGVRADYQPILDMGTGRIHGWEALVRGRHPQMGEVSAVVLVEAATRHEMLDDLTLQMAEQALYTVGEAALLAGERLCLTLNIEIEQLRRDCRVMQWLLDHGQIPGVDLLLEITERGEDVWTEEHELTARSLEVVGIRLGLDDYGAGAARLEFLHHRDWAVVKLDRRFLLHDTPRDRTILLYFAEMLRELGIPRVAEGIETPAQLQRARALGVEYAQGYWLGRPAAADVVLGQVRSTGLNVRLLG